MLESARMCENQVEAQSRRCERDHLLIDVIHVHRDGAILRLLGRGLLRHQVHDVGPFFLVVFADLPSQDGLEIRTTVHLQDSKHSSFRLFEELFRARLSFCVVSSSELFSPWALWSAEAHLLREAWR